MAQRDVARSQFLSFALRHRPDEVGLVLDGHRVRAAQGHSVEVDLDLEPRTPPPVLFHGTVERFLASILADGLEPRARQHVHLSADVETATTVGSRRGKPVILSIDAEGLHRHGQVFWRSANGVWLTEQVEPRWISAPQVG